MTTLPFYVVGNNSTGYNTKMYYVYRYQFKGLRLKGQWHQIFALQIFAIKPLVQNQRTKF